MPSTTLHSATPDEIRSGLARVRAGIEVAAARAGRSPVDVTIVAAVKYLDLDGCRLLVEHGVRNLAESRYEQLTERQDTTALGQLPVRWHFIGRLQSRQVPALAERCELLHTLCTDSAARRLARGQGESRCDVLVQVNVAGDPAKDGLAPADVERFLLGLPDDVHVSGFMAMPAFAPDPEASRPAFAALRELRDRLAPLVAGRHDLRALSIGTSQDFTVAVEEGATHVRLGRILYADGE